MIQKWTIVRGGAAAVLRLATDVSARVLRAPFPWYGGKFHAAPMVWRAFGNVPNYVEPFAGSLATLLARPHEPKVETVNDKDGLIANFWRATTAAPDDVARWADWPVNEADLHARHQWLVTEAFPLTERLIADPDYFDAKIAGWWVWGICTWIGGGWCYPDVRLSRRRPVLNNANGHGLVATQRQVPRIGIPGNGVHAPSRKKHRNKGINADSAPTDILHRIADRLRNVRVCCGDWTRVLGRSTLGIDTAHGMTPCGVLLDPPYAHDLRGKQLYREDALNVSTLARMWAIEHGDNPALRIALCGYIGEHEMPSSWTVAAWASTSSSKSRAKERIWFSPHCLDPSRQGELFAEASAAQRDNHTIENQLRVLPAFIAAQGWTLAGTYTDDGRSAKSGKLDARDGFAALLRDAEARRFDLLVVVDVDRLTRTDSIEERARIIGPFQRLGIDIVTPSGGRLDMRTMLGELWVTIQAIGASEENRKRAERIKAGKLRAIAEGRKPAGPTPFGLTYTRATGLWSIDEGRAPLVREMFRRVTAGEACTTIAEDFTRRGELAPRTGWSGASVYRIVRKRTACGEFTADKARGAVLVVPAIVSPEQWHDAQRALMRHKRRGLVRTKHVYLLEGLARCADCGSPIAIRSATRNPTRTNGNPSPAAYVCRGRKIDRTCRAPIVKCAELDARIWERLCEELVQPDLIAALAEVGRDRAGDARDWQLDAETHRAHLARLGQVEAKVMERFRRGTVSEDALDVELAALGRERRFVRDQLGTAERALGANLSARERLDAASSAVVQLRAALPNATPEQRQALLRELARDGGVLASKGRALLDLRLVRAAATSRDVGVVAAVIALDDSAGYRMQCGAIESTPMRLRLVA